MNIQGILNYLKIKIKYCFSDILNLEEKNVLFVQYVIFDEELGIVVIDGEFFGYIL